MNGFFCVAIITYRPTLSTKPLIVSGKFLLLFSILPLCFYAQGWLQLPDFPGLERDDGVAIRVNDKAYFGTGLREGFTLGSDFYALDLNALTWTSITAMPTGTQRQYASAFAGQESFYVLAGEGLNGLTTDMYKYSLVTNNWTEVAPKPGNGILGMCSFEFGDKVIFAGGRFSDGSLSNEVWEYNITSDNWTQKNNFPFGGRWRASGTVYNNTGYFMFGMDSTDSFRKDLYAYSLVTDSWTKLGDFPGPGRTHATLKVTGNQLILFGGIDSLGNYYNDLWRFNPVQNSWSQGPTLPSFGRKGGMGLSLGAKFYYSCGVTATERLKQTWMFELNTGIKENIRQPEVSFFPNPVGDYIYLDAGNEHLTELILIDRLGREIRKLPCPEDNQHLLQLGLNGLQTGIYYLKITDENHYFTVKKLVKE